MTTPDAVLAAASAALMQHRCFCDRVAEALARLPRTWTSTWSDPGNFVFRWVTAGVSVFVHLESETEPNEGCFHAVLTYGTPIHPTTYVLRNLDQVTWKLQELGVPMGM